MTPVEAFIQATGVRAKAYWFIYDELVREFGRDKAREVFSRATFRLGADKAASFPEESGVSAEALAEAFVKDPIGREVFSQSVLEASPDKAEVEMKRCPLVEVWKEMKLPGETVRELCDIACRVDFGTIETQGMKLHFPQRISYGAASCILDINKQA